MKDKEILQKVFSKIEKEFDDIQHIISCRHTTYIHPNPNKAYEHGFDRGTLTGLQLAMGIIFEEINNV